LEAVRGAKEDLHIRFNSREPRFLSATYSNSDNDIETLMAMLADWAYIYDQTMGGRNARVSPHGLLAIDDLTKKHVASSQGFIAMWFDPTLNDAYTMGRTPESRLGGTR
jgi:hypothetical protein